MGFHANCPDCNARSQAASLNKIAGHLDQQAVAQRAADKQTRREERRARKGGGALWDEQLIARSTASLGYVVLALVAGIVLIGILVLLGHLLLILIPVIICGGLGFLGWRVWTRRQTRRQIVEPSLTPPGWYPDPNGTGALRWYDGMQWTEHLGGQT